MNGHYHDMRATRIPQDMPLGKLRGLGGKLGAALEQHCGATTAGQVQALGMELLAKHLGPERARWVGGRGGMGAGGVGLLGTVLSGDVFGSLGRLHGMRAGALCTASKASYSGLPAGPPC